MNNKKKKNNRLPTTTPDTKLNNFIDEISARIFKLSKDPKETEFRPTVDLVQLSFQSILELYDRKDTSKNLLTGFSDLDNLTQGFRPGDLIVIASYPSIGKTALALNIAQNAAISKKLNIGIFSLEHSAEQLTTRMICSEAQVDSSKVRTGYLADRDFPRIIDAGSKLAHANIFIDDTPSHTISTIKHKAHKLHTEKKLSLIILDFVQLIKSSPSQQNYELEIAEISRALKNLAQELNIPIILTSQLYHHEESRNDYRPRLSDLRESRAIERSADLILFVYRDEVYNPNTPDKNIAEIIFAKHRGGPTGVVKLKFSQEFLRFEDLEDPSSANLAI